MQAAVKQRDQTLQEVHRNQQKLDKLVRLERTGPNIGQLSHYNQFWDLWWYHNT
jgi:hypothetical protein